MTVKFKWITMELLEVLCYVTTYRGIKRLRFKLTKKKLLLLSVEA